MPHSRHGDISAQQTLVLLAAKDRNPEGFLMRAGVQLYRQVLRAARVDKPRKEEAAGAGWDLWGKSADGRD
jgi:hypothetical protein